MLSFCLGEVHMYYMHTRKNVLKKRRFGTWTWHRSHKPVEIGTVWQSPEAKSSKIWLGGRRPVKNVAVRSKKNPRIGCSLVK
jgi:hypothetical protein